MFCVLCGEIALRCFTEIKMATKCEQVPIFNLVIMLDHIFSRDGNYQFYPELSSPFHIINSHIIEKELTWNWNGVVNDEASFAGLFLLNVTELKLVFLYSASA